MNRNLTETSIRLLASVLAHPGLCLTHAAAHANIAKPSAHERARALVRDKLLTRSGPARKPVYSLTPAAIRIVRAHTKAAAVCPVCGNKTNGKRP